jgi:hypothetical protein
MTSAISIVAITLRVMIRRKHCEVILASSYSPIREVGDSKTCRIAEVSDNSTVQTLVTSD